ncbi:hypothetical protein IWX78_002704 [Mycetocola sp. CAN_C7]|uniref:hypothetical protein n=1 Tax=Mycetocola sp. CAN_C7 TaxID=2787724 RepID=UPI0018CB3C5A
MGGHKPARVIPVVVGLAIGFVSAALPIAPWLATGATLPLQNLWQTSVLPEDMPFSLLPVNQYYAIRIAVILVVGGALAGLTIRFVRWAAGVPSWSASAGLLLAHGIAIIQSFVAVADGLGIAETQSDPRPLLYFGGMLSGTVVAALLAQGVFWLASRRAVGPVTLALTLSAVPFASWIVDAVTMLSAPAGPSLEISSISRWLPAIIVGAALGWCGVRPLHRLGIWLISLAALWITPALFTSLWNALGMRILDGDLRAMKEVATQIFPLALSIGALPVLLALVLGGIISGAQVTIHRRALRSGAADGHTAHPTK